MNSIVSVDTDEEIDRWNEAALMAANPPPLDLTQNKMKVYNKSTGQNDIVMPMDAGGFVVLGQEPIDRSLKIQQYARELQNMGMPFDQKDLEAAGYSAEEINAAGVLPVATEPPRTEPMSEGERLIELRSGGAVIEPMPESPWFGNAANLTLAEKWSPTTEIAKGLARGGLVRPVQFLKDNFGIYDPLYLQLTDPVTGEFDPAIKILSREEKEQLDADLAAGKLPYALDFEQLVEMNPDASVGAQFGGDLAQFIGAFAGIGKLFRIGNGIKAGFTQGAAADFLAFKGDEGRITDLLLEMGVPENQVTNFLKTDPNDPDYVGRFKTSLEGGIFGSLIEVTPLLLSMGKTFRAVKDGDVPLEELDQAINTGKQSLLKTAQNKLVDLGQAAETRIAEEGDTLFSNPITPMTDRMLKLIGRLVAPKEKTIILEAMPDEEIAAAAQAQIAAQKDNYKPSDGWLQEGMEVTSVKRKKNGSIEVKYKEVPYNFHVAPEGVDAQKWEQTITNKTVKQVKDLAKRAAAGDQAALDIIAQANWYRSMRARMRLEFGGLGDVYADLLGTTSAQTGVTQNWDNAVEIMRRFSRGEYDQEIAMYEEMLARGEANPIDLGKLHNDPNSPFKLITTASGALFNANSPASTKALLDMFRVAKGAPKTPNFTGNLIGYTNAATVDVWAARFLRRMSGQKRLPPPVEKGVAGDHMKDSTLENPLVGSEFGFGQRVIQAAVDTINKSGVIKNIDPSIGDMGADDLQAVMWFMEKEIWTRNNWTSKAGEGGSLDFEASLAGSADQGRIKELRTIINKKFTAPKPLKQKADETDEAYQARMAEREAAARKKYDEGVAAADAELQTKFTPLMRYVLGISTERPGARPTNVQQADTAARLAEPVNDDESVVMFQINNSYGRFMSKDERSFNAEFVVRENFTPTALRNRMVEIGRDADQDSVFISKIVPDRTPESRPGVEIYFKQRKDKDFAVTLSDKLTEYGVDGFTFITDARAFDTPARQANLNEEAVAGITGLRFQYIPEFDMGADAWKAMTPDQKAAKIDEIERKFRNIIIDIKSQGDDISTAIVTHNETEVIERGSYDAILGTQVKMKPSLNVTQPNKPIVQDQVIEKALLYGKLNSNKDSLFFENVSNLSSDLIDAVEASINALNIKHIEVSTTVSNVSPSSYAEVRILDKNSWDPEYEEYLDIEDEFKLRFSDHPDYQQYLASDKTIRFDESVTLKDIEDVEGYAGSTIDYEEFKDLVQEGVNSILSYIDE